MLKTYRGDAGILRLALAAAGFNDTGTIFNDRGATQRLKYWHSHQVCTAEMEGSEKYLVMLSNLEEMFGKRLIYAKSSYGSFCVYLVQKDFVLRGNAPAVIDYPASAIPKPAKKAKAGTSKLGAYLYTSTVRVYERGIQVVAVK